MSTEATRSAVRVRHHKEMNSQPYTAAKNGSPPEVDWRSRRLYLTISRDGGVIFDLDKDEFLKLDVIATQIWTGLIEGKSKDEVAQSIASEWNADKKQVRRDIDDLLQSGAERGITPQSLVLVPASGQEMPQTLKNFPYYGQDPSQVGPRPTPTMIIKAAVFLLLFDLTLTVFSLKTLCGFVNRWRIRGGPADDADLIGRVCIAVEKACIWYPKKAVCLQRSAVTVCLLKSHGVAAQMIVGARVMPMVSHAWVEVDGSVVNDHVKVRTVYQRLAAF